MIPFNDTGIVENMEDETVFIVIYKKYWDALLTFAQKYISDKELCKEIVQDLFITLHLRRKDLSINVSISSYLFRSLRNKIINHLRKESIYQKHLTLAGNTLNAITTENEGEHWMDVYYLKKQVYYCLEKMPVKYREVYILAVLNDTSVQRTAQILQRPVPTVDRQIRITTRLVNECLRKNKWSLL